MSNTTSKWISTNIGIVWNICNIFILIDFSWLVEGWHNRHSWSHIDRCAILRYLMTSFLMNRWHFVGWQMYKSVKLINKRLKKKTLQLLILPTTDVEVFNLFFVKLSHRLFSIEICIQNIAIVCYLIHGTP